MVRKSQRMRMPRSEEEHLRAMVATSLGPSPTARKTSRSMAALRAAVRWWACNISKTRPGLGGTVAALDECIGLLRRAWMGNGSEDAFGFYLEGDGMGEGLFRS